MNILISRRFATWTDSPFNTETLGRRKTFLKLRGPPRHLARHSVRSLSSIFNRASRIIVHCGARDNFISPAPESQFCLIWISRDVDLAVNSFSKQGVLVIFFKNAYTSHMGVKS